MLITKERVQIMKRERAKLIHFKQNMETPPKF